MAVTLGNIYIKDSADWNTYLDLIYPVGSIYMTTSSTSPASSIGGSWSQIEPGTFLMAAGESYNVLSTGGENTHTLTVGEMPSHTHSFNGNWPLVASGPQVSGMTGSWGNGNIYTGMRNAGYTGDGQAHNNMPRYIAVNIYYRTF
mgnify:CR=1 FL=1